MHKPLFLITAGSVAACGALIFATASPAAATTSVRAETTLPVPPACTAPNAGACADTPVTFTLTTTGVLAITAPTDTVDLGTGNPHNVGTLIGAPGNFGAVTVTDNRGLDPANWTATVSSTNFTNVASPIDVIPVADATYAVGAVAPALPLRTSANANGTSITLTGAAQGVVTQSGFDGDNAATWTPTIDVLVPAGAVIGTYDGTVTHSVS
jgi:hypothetical protein